MSDAVTLVIGALRVLPTVLGLGLLAGRAGWALGAWWFSLIPFVSPPKGMVEPSPWWLASELVLGMAFAFALCGPLWAVRQGGRLLELGYAGGPGGGAALRLLFGVLGLALFATLGGFRLWSSALVEASMPTIASNVALSELALAAATQLTLMLRLALAVAAPAWIALVLLDLAVAFLSRLSGAPGHAIVGASMPLRLLSIAVALPLSMQRLPEWLRLSLQAAMRMVSRFTA